MYFENLLSSSGPPLSKAYRKTSKISKNFENPNNFRIEREKTKIIFAKLNISAFNEYRGCLN